MSQTTRRTFLGSASIAASASVLGTSAGCGKQRPEIPITKPSRTRPLDGIEREKITITDVRVRLFSYVCPPEKWWYGAGVTTLTEIFTDQGIVGIGGPTPYANPEQVKTYTDEIIKPALMGENPFDVELLTCGGSNWVSGGSWAGADNALWDIIGKAKNLPVYRLLATDNEPNPHIKCYASCGTLHNWKKRPDDLIDEALRFRDEGFSAYKFRLGEKFEEVMTIKTYIPWLEKLRNAVGYDFDLLHENNMRLSLDQCLELAPVLEELKFLWLEEPITIYERGTIEGYITINKALPNVLVSGGETRQNRFSFKEWIDRDAYDIVQPDCNTTGITEAWHIARMAHLKGKLCCPHNWHGGLTKMANAHLVAGIPNHLMLEENRHNNPFHTELFTEPMVVKNGYLDLPDRPGYGMEIIDDADKRFPYDPKHHWNVVGKLRES